MIKKIDEYLDKLKRELRGSDPALIQDALFDAEEYLRTALEDYIENTPGLSEEEALQPLVERYGNPSEVASAYREIESRVLPTLASPKAQASRPPWAKFFGVVSDRQAWGAFLYMLLSGLAGCIFGMWALFGTAISLFSLILIIGLPFTGLFLLSIRGIALVEGRIVEELLGLRMPRKPLFVQKGIGWHEKFKVLITESHTWKALAYVILHFPIGLVYFFGTAILVALSLKCFLYPLWYWGLERPLIDLKQPFYPPVWSIPLITVAGIIIFLLILHLAKSAGKIHGRFAKYMLVRKQNELFK
ncbi:MAG: sensor domain-containing protein [Candidatus Aminicenantes bacterium]|nr:MAG: sensor domain-containing protein [Candidatus Aminicenantes bacterium]